MVLTDRPKNRDRPHNPCICLSLRAPEGCVAISTYKGEIRFARNDNCYLCSWGFTIRLTRMRRPGRRRALGARGDRDGEEERMTRIGRFRGGPWRGLLAAGGAVLALTAGPPRPPGPRPPFLPP